MIFRSFGYLRSRLILNQQDILRSLERRLDGADAADANMDSRRRLLCCREGDDDQEHPIRKGIFGKLKEELKVYGSVNLEHESPQLTWPR